MDWFTAIDGYCERLGPGLLAEPLNLVTNAAFPIAAVWIWPHTRGMPMARAMAVVLVLIGIGSAAFHSFANVLAGVFDVVPILGFVLLYLYAASRDFLNLRPAAAGLAVVGFFPFSLALFVMFRRTMPWLGSSAGYAPLPVLILIYAVLVRPVAPSTAWRLAGGAALLVLSLTFRVLDLRVCTGPPIGTHFLWHLLNALLLGWLVLVYCRHRLAAEALHS